MGGGGLTAFPNCKEQIEFFFVVPCSAGTFLDPMKSSCTDCPVGTYKEIPENVDCTRCPSGKSTETTGSRNITSCLSKHHLITTVKSFKFLGGAMFVNNQTLTWSCVASVDTWQLSVSNSWGCKVTNIGSPRNPRKLITQGHDGFTEFLACDNIFMEKIILSWWQEKILYFIRKMQPRRIFKNRFRTM